MNSERRSETIKPHFVLNIACWSYWFINSASWNLNTNKQNIKVHRRLWPTRATRTRQATTADKRCQQKFGSLKICGNLIADLEDKIRRKAKTVRKVINKKHTNFPHRTLESSRTEGAGDMQVRGMSGSKNKSWNIYPYPVLLQYIRAFLS